MTQVPDWEDLGMPALPQPIYVAGPMSGKPFYNFPAFARATKRLRGLCYDVVSPAELDEAEGDVGEHEWEHYIRRDLKVLADCGSVAVLEGWRDSRGASLEVHIARTLGMPVVDAETLEPVAESVLEEADRLVSGDRQKDYGHPLDDFTRTGRFWGAVLGIPDVPAEQVALCMVGVKMSREVNRPKRDNRVDGPGYWKCLDMIHHERARREDDNGRDTGKVQMVPGPGGCGRCRVDSRSQPA